VLEINTRDVASGAGFKCFLGLLRLKRNSGPLGGTKNK
jgi:hypothetical protein